VFDVVVEGATRLDDYDIFADVGKNKAVMKSFVVTSNANLDIDFLRVTHNPTVTAIEILRAGTGTALVGTSLSAPGEAVSAPSPASRTASTPALPTGLTDMGLTLADRVSAAKARMSLAALLRDSSKSDDLPSKEGLSNQVDAASMRPMTNENDLALAKVEGARHRSLEWKAATIDFVFEQLQIEVAGR
jgi:hypothetical protein